MKNIQSLALGLCAAVVLAACSSAPKTPPAAEAKGVTQVAPVSAPAKPVASPQATAAPAVASVVLPAYLDPKSPISINRSVFFDYENDSIKKEYGPLIELQGKFLATHPALSVRIEGNADERGSAEYNLALGQKRAEAVSRALRVYGVKDSQMEALSWGKEKPRATGHDESSWAMNRRADIDYPKK